jgi:mRNA interferase MazF
MKRGDIILVHEPNTPASKPRPYVVVQRNSALESPAKVTACPLTSVLQGSAGQRPFIAPNDQNGLRRPSEVEIDWIYTHPIDYVGGVIGEVDMPTMTAIDLALRRWLDL